MFYLDPHTVQSVQSLSLASDMTALQHTASTYHCHTIQSIAVQSIDPSLAIGFYISDWSQWHEFWEQAKLVSCISTQKQIDETYDDEGNQY